MKMRKALKIFRSPLSSATHLSVDRYGDLIYDLCLSTLRNPTQAQITFRRIIKKLKSQTLSFSKYERGWILSITAKLLIQTHQDSDQNPSAQEQLKLDSETVLEKRLHHFFYYLHRLPIENQILLILKDKHQIPFSDISIALSIPEGSLKLQYQQSLSTLEEWLWKTP
jgi:DNA-directed RNA polymerase specialized sigma24 family protein